MSSILLLRVPSFDCLLARSRTHQTAAPQRGISHHRRRVEQCIPSPPREGLVKAMAAEWIERCSLRVLEQAPGLDDAFADELARKLHAAWPKLSPERAAACFFAPAISAAESYAVELA